MSVGYNSCVLIVLIEKNVILLLIAGKRVAIRRHTALLERTEDVSLLT